MAGQAISYKVGERVWLEARADAKRRKGAAFDLKEFHTYALDLGSMGLAQLQDEARPVLASRHDQPAREFSETTFTDKGDTKTVYAKARGPGVVVMSEMPGITPNVAASRSGWSMPLHRRDAADVRHARRGPSSPTC